MSCTIHAINSNTPFWLPAFISAFAHAFMLIKTLWVSFFRHFSMQFLTKISQILACQISSQWLKIIDIVFWALKINFTLANSEDPNENFFLYTVHLYGQIQYIAVPLLEQVTLCILASSADNLYKQFGSRSGPTKCRAWSGYKLFDTLMVFLKEILEKVDFEKNQQTTKTRKSSQNAGNRSWCIRSLFITESFLLLIVYTNLIASYLNGK